MEGTLDEWTVAALAMIRRTLDTLALPVVDGDGKNRGGRLRRSLASALASKDCSPTNGRRLTRVSTSTRIAGGDESNEMMHSRHHRGQSMLRRLLSTGLGRVQGQGQAQGEAVPQAQADVEDGQEDGQHRRQHEESQGGARALSASIAGSGSSVDGGVVVASSSSSSSPPSPSSVWQGLAQQQQQQQQGGGGPSAARADFDELLRDAQAETGSGMGIGGGIGRGTGRGRDVMGELLETSEELIKAVEMQQKVSCQVML